MLTSAADILREAREAASLSQRALATAAGTAQSVVARIELGATSPSWDTLARLVRAAGSTLTVRLGRQAVSAIDLTDVPRIMSLSPAQRLQELRNAERFLTAVRRVA